MRRSLFENRRVSLYAVPPDWQVPSNWTLIETYKEWQIYRTTPLDTPPIYQTFQPSLRQLFDTFVTVNDVKSWIDSLEQVQELPWALTIVGVGAGITILAFTIR